MTTDTPLHDVIQAAEKLSPQYQLTLIEHLLTLATPVIEKPLPTEQTELWDFYLEQNRRMFDYLQANLTSDTREGLLQAMRFYNDALAANFMDLRHYLAVYRLHGQMWTYRDAEIVEFRISGQSRPELARKLVSEAQATSEKLEQVYSQIHTLWDAMSQWLPPPPAQNSDE